MKLLGKFALIVMFCIAPYEAISAEKQGVCNLVFDRSIVDQGRQGTKRLMTCLREGRSIKLDKFYSDVDWRSLAFNPEVPLQFELQEGLKRLDYSILASRNFSRLYAGHVCRKLGAALDRLELVCPIPGFFDVSMADIINMGFGSGPKQVNFDHIGAPLTIRGGDLDLIWDGGSHGRTYMVMRRLALKSIRAWRLDLERVILLGDFVIVDSDIDSVSLNNIFVLGDVAFKNSRFGDLGIENLMGARKFQGQNLSGKRVSIRNMAFAEAELEGFSFKELNVWQERELEEFRKTGVYRDY